MHHEFPIDSEDPVFIPEIKRRRTEVTRVKTLFLVLTICAIMWLLGALWMVYFVQGFAIGKEHVEHAAHHPVKTDHYSPDGDHNADFDHEAVLGSKKKDFSELSSDDAEKELGKMADQMDVDKDGFISKVELVEWITHSFQSLDDEEAVDKMEESDENLDGAISWEEHLKQTYDYLPDEIEDFHEDQNPEVRSLHDMISLDKEKFDRADKNQDGTLNEAEYSAFLHPYNHLHMRDLELKEIMLDYDKNKDGAISFEEFLGNEEDIPFEKEQQLAEEENFKNFDVNKDAVLNADEVAAWAMPSHDESAVEEAEHLLEESDSDNDGRLTKLEIIEQQDLWVGSTATEYSRHDPGEL